MTDAEFIVHMRPIADLIAPLMDSPIEARLIGAVVRQTWEAGGGVTVIREAGHDVELHRSYRPTGQMRSPVTLIIPQALIAGIHVDFALSVHRSFDGGASWQSGLVLVECDGHAYHERTPEQASRDKARDRLVQKLGYPVFRYSGRDIHRSALGCAAEILEEAGRRAGRVH